MTFSLDINKNTIALGSVKPHEIIEYESEHVDKDIFMILSIDRDDTIPAILLQLWKFHGGYNHQVVNVMENDLGVNTQVPFFEPKSISGTIERIQEYRPEDSGLSKKEEFFFDVIPNTTSKTQNEGHTIPYIVEVRIGDKTENLTVPEWTPLQKLPVKRIKPGTELEIWRAGSFTNIMKVLQL